MRTAVNIAHLRPLDHKTSMQLAAKENELFAALLRSLSGDDWNTATDCDLWSVRDIVAHLIGWGECLTSFKEAGHQVNESFRRRHELGGMTHAQNQVQVDDRRRLTPDELVRTYEQVSVRFLAFRKRVGVIGKAIPLYNPLVGGLASVGFVSDTIFTRDTFMHRIDITRATGREMVMGLHQETLVTDIVRDWAGRVGAPVRAELSGPGGGSFDMDGARATVGSTAIDFCRFLAGRASRSDLEVEGDPAVVGRVLEVSVPF